MPNTEVDLTGDGITSDLIQVGIQLGDSGSTVSVEGQVQKVGFPAVQVTGSPLTFPAAPGSGVINVIVQVDYTVGAATIKQNTTPGVFPTPDPNNVWIWRGTLTPSTTDLAADPSVATPDST